MDFFHEVGSVTVVFKGMERIGVKIRPYTKDPEESSYFGDLIDIVEAHHEEIEDAAPREDLLVVDETIYQMLEKVVRLSEEPINKRALIKQAVRKGLGLSKRDVVVIFHGKVYIRIYKILNNKNFPAIERRFQGLPEEEMQQLQHEYFAGGVEPFLVEVAQSAMEGPLHVSSVDNETFEKSNVRVMHKALSDALETKIGEEKMVLEGFAGYLMRRYFQLIYRSMSAYLIEQLSTRDAETDAFLRYYDGQIVLGSDGKKYRRPEIVDKEGIRWNLATIIAVAMQRKKDLESLHRQSEQIDVLEEDLFNIEQEISGQGVEEGGDLATVAKELDNCREELGALREKLESLRTQMKGSSTDEQARIGEEIEAVNQEIEGLRQMEEELLMEQLRLTKEAGESQQEIAQMIEEKERLRRKHKEESSKIEALMASQKEVRRKYELIVDALAIALSKRKERNIGA